MRCSSSPQRVPSPSKNNHRRSSNTRVQFIVNDFNNDAIPDILTFGPQFIRIHKISGTTLPHEFEVTGITPTSISVFDINRDGTIDFIVAGKNQQNQPVTEVFYGLGSFKFKRQHAPLAIDGKVSLTDVNDDGLFDVVVTGGTQSVIMTNQADTLKVETTFDGLPNANLFTGDMTSDGQADMHLSAKKVNHVRELTGIITALDTTGVIIQRMGDQDRDGDLDLMQVIDSIGSQWLKFYDNTSGPNHHPGAPGNGFAITASNKTFIIWEPAGDDKTNSKSLTYDVWLGTSDVNVISPSFYIPNGRRQVVRHGNAGTSNAMVITGLTDARYYYLIQAVDNAYNGGYGMCSGGVLPCFDLAHEDVQACRDNEVVLVGGKGAIWYSMERGLLAKTDTLKFAAVKNDTLFAFVPQAGECAKNKVYAVHVNEKPPSETETIHACKGKEIKLEIAPGWSEIKWDTNPVVTNVSSITYTVNAPVTITATATSQGCTYKKQFFIKLSEPIVTIQGDGFQVLKGNSVQIEGGGNAQTWLWNPPQGLSDSTIPNPMATPSQTTEYVLTGTDSVGCTATATTHIFVQETAFIPNLFTPNGDGKNDNIMVYGLTTASRFSFKIFNREGSLVYETKDISQVSSTGWNGFVQGTRQPSGLYYWKVDGEMPNGDKLLLNGKTNGSILLVH